MPRKKAKRKLVEFSEIEWELLHYLARGGPAQAVVRNALLNLARHDPAFQVDAFAQHLRQNVLPGMNQRQRDDLTEQLGELRRYLAGDIAPRLDEQIESSAIFRR